VQPEAFNEAVNYAVNAAEICPRSKYPSLILWNPTPTAMLEEEHAVN
jgi:hypothetical protein